MKKDNQTKEASGFSAAPCSADPIDTVLESGKHGLISILEVAEDDIIISQACYSCAHQLQHLSSARVRIRKAIDHIKHNA